MSKSLLISAFLTLGVFNASITLAADESLQPYELRREFIESSLAAAQQHARYWQNGWMTFYAVSALGQTVLWIDSDNNDDSINYSIGALKSIGGLADMFLRPHPGRFGATPLLDLPENTPEQRRNRLTLGETLLKNSAERAASRRTWQPHLKVFGVNIIAGALIAAFGDEGDALLSTGLGIAIGEANIWTQPTRPEQDWREYQERFLATGSSTISDWELVPAPDGLALRGRF